MGKATVSVRELQQNLKQVLARVERGQVIEVTRRGRPVARLSPTRPADPAAPWPDLDARARAVFGERIVKPSPSQRHRHFDTTRQRSRMNVVDSSEWLEYFANTPNAPFFANAIEDIERLVRTFDNGFSRSSGAFSSEIGTGRFGSDRVNEAGCGC